MTALSFASALSFDFLIVQMLNAASFLQNVCISICGFDEASYSDVLKNSCQTLPVNYKQILFLISIFIFSFYLMLNRLESFTIFLDSGVSQMSLPDRSPYKP